jgi:hypothetical protein
MFKSVAGAVEDLVAAQYILKNVMSRIEEHD